MNVVSLAPIAPRLAKLLPLLASDKSGEVVATAQAIGRTLRTIGADFHDLAATFIALPAPSRRSTEPTGWPEIVDFCLARTDLLTERDIEFLEDIGPKLDAGLDPSIKQAAWLRGLLTKVRRAGGRQ